MRPRARGFAFPAFLADPEGSLTGPENLLIFDTEALGEVTITGPGAGRRATGHAVIADLLAVHRSVS